MTEEQLDLFQVPRPDRGQPAEHPRESRRARKRRRRVKGHTDQSRQDSHPAMGWYIPAHVMGAGDGTWIIRPGKPVQRGTAEAVSRATGIHRKVLHRLADIGLIRRQRPTPFTSIFFYAEVEDLLARTETDLNFWTDIRREAYINGNSLRDARPK